METNSIGRAIGAASLALGVTDVAMGRVFGRGIGAGEEMGGRLFRTVGVREIATGIAGLAWPASRRPILARLAGDVADLAVLGYIAAPGNPKRKMAFAALVVVAGVALVDFLGARAMAKRAAP